MIVLGLETSCDETGLALYDSELGLRGQVLYSQIKLHAEYGGVVPELASRDHVRKMIPLINQLLEQSGVQKNQIDAVAYTRGPGLMGTLMTGALFGRTLAFALNKPGIGVHHMEGHMLAPLLSENPPEFPFVALLVSGGHTQLMAAYGIGQYELLGESIDDAAGEAFDKVAENYDKIKSQNPGFDGQITIEGLKSAIFAWNVVAIALTEKGLDDFIYLDNNDIKSISLKGKVSKDEPTPDSPKPENKKGRGRSPQSETATDETVNVKEKQEQEP